MSRVVGEPVGVCGLITPGSYPLLRASWSDAPALLVGNTIVVKPGELSPSASVLLMKALEGGRAPGRLLAAVQYGALGEVGRDKVDAWLKQCRGRG